MKPIFTLTICLFFSMMLQAQVQKAVELTAGSLRTTLTADELNTVTKLTISGTMDARDFKTIHDEMPLLEELDISEVTIEAYTYYYSTDYSSETHIYPANTIPYAFSWNEDHLTDYALAGHPNLANLKLPASITSIGYFAFHYCTSLSSIELPPSVTSIQSMTFYGCTSLASLILPSNFNYIGTDALAGCGNLKSIYCYAVNPPEWHSDYDFLPVFEYMDMANCIIHVPYGTKERYKKAGEWGLFKNIVEMPGFSLSANNINLEAEPDSTSTIEVLSGIPWTASSDQPWLMVSPSSGTGDHRLIFTADANTADTTRSAIVTVSATDIADQTIEVTQLSVITRVHEIAQNRLVFNCYPNPFTQQVTIEIQNPQQKKMTIDIYNLAGRKVKNLANGITDEEITLSWDATNDQGQQVVPGVYICRMNRQSIQVVKGK